MHCVEISAYFNLHCEPAPVNPLTAEIAATAARLVVEEGLEFGPAKHRALKVLGLSARTPLPGNDELEAEVRDYIALFCADTQAVELRALRQHAREWMERLAPFRPHLGGAVWRGVARRRGAMTSFCSCFVTTANRPK